MPDIWAFLLILTFCPDFGLFLFQPINATREQNN